MAKDVFSRLPHFHNLSTNQQATLLAVVHRCDSIYKLPRGEANSIAREIGATGQTVRNYARMIRLIVQLYQTKPLDLTSWLEDNAANSTEKRFLQCLYSPQYSWADLQAQPEDSEDKAVCGDVALQVAALERRLANTKAAFAQLNGDYDELKEEYDKATAALIKAQQIIRRISTEIDDGAPDDLYDYTPPIQGKTRPSNQFAEQEDLPKKYHLASTAHFLLQLSTHGYFNESGKGCASLRKKTLEKLFMNSRSRAERIVPVVKSIANCMEQGETPSVVASSSI
jgi:hypothetical protein